MANAIGMPQQNTWGNIDAMIPILMALFFIFVFLGVPIIYYFSGM